jgi:hypothetical protein
LTGSNQGRPHDQRSCGAKAKELGHKYFSIQDGNECYTGNDRYDRFGRAEGDCPPGGAPWKARTWEVPSNTPPSYVPPSTPSYVPPPSTPSYVPPPSTPSYVPPSTPLAPPPTDPVTDSDSDIVTNPDPPIDSPIINETSLCPADRIPPCQSGFISDTITNSSGESTTCCLIDPNRNDPTIIQQHINFATNLAKDAIRGGVLDYAAKTADDILAKKGLTFGADRLNKLSDQLARLVNGKIKSAALLTVEKESAKVLAKYIVASASGGANLATLGTNAIGSWVLKEVGKSLGIKLGEKTAVRAVEGAAKIGAKMATEAAMGPVGWVLLAFDIFSMGLDMGDPGAYNNVTYLSDYKKVRDKANDTFNNQIIKAGGKTPIIVSPLNKLPEGPISRNINDIGNGIPQSIGDIVLFIENEYCLTYATGILSNLNFLTLSFTEQQNAIQKIISDAATYFDTDTGKEYLNKRMCSIVGGVMTPDGQCTYKDRASCDTSYDWNKIKTAMINKTEISDNYVEYRDGKCILVNPVLRSSCEDNGVAYNYDKQLCTITDNYCRSKGLTPINTADGTDCKLEVGQGIAEMIFGTTIVRGLIQVFDPEQYESCNGDEHDGNNVPKELRDLLYSSIVLPPPLNIPGILFATLGNKVCVKSKGCQDGTEESAGLCYTPCSSGYTSDKMTMCYKNCNNGDVTVGVLCREACRPGYTDIAGVCWASCPAGTTDDGALCRHSMVWDNCSWRGAYGECVGGLKGGQVVPKDSYVPSTRARESYTRGVGKTPISVRVKGRKVPYGKK